MILRFVELKGKKLGNVKLWEYVTDWMEEYVIYHFEGDCNGLFSFDDFSFVYETWRGSTNYFTKLKCHVKLIFIRNILLVSYLDV